MTNLVGWKGCVKRTHRNARGARDSDGTGDPRLQQSTRSLGELDEIGDGTVRQAGPLLVSWAEEREGCFRKLNRGRIPLILARSVPSQIAAEPLRLTLESQRAERGSL